MANRQIGAFFSVPSSNPVQYTVSDGVNEYKGCSFNVTSKGKMYIMLEYLYFVIQFYPWFRFPFPLFLGMVVNNK